MAEDLLSLLDLYTSRLVSALAAQHGVMGHGAGKAALMTGLAKALAEPARIKAQWASLSPNQLALAEAILQRGGRASQNALRFQLERQGVTDRSLSPAAEGFGRSKAPDPRNKNSRRFEDLLAALMLRGLVFAGSPAEGPAYSTAGVEPPKVDFDRLPPAVLVPEAVRRHLPAPPPLPLPASLQPVTAAPVLAGSARTFQRDLYLYWSYIRDHGVYVTQKDEVGKADLKKINATLLVRETLGKGEGELEHPRLRFLRHTLTALKLLAFEDSTAQPAAADFFALPPAARVQRCFEAWRGTELFNELLLLPKEARPARPELSLLVAPPLILQARQTVLRAVASACAPQTDGAWLTLKGLCDWLSENDYEFLLRRSARHHGLTGYYPAPPYSAATNPIGVDFPGVRNEAEGWDLVEANFIRGVVRGPLYWLGLVDLGAIAGGLPGGPAGSGGLPAGSGGLPAGPDAFCLTPMGRWLLGLGPSPEIPESGGRVIVQPNLHIVALDPVNDALLVALDAFAERLTAERAVEYRLTRASVYAGQQAGWSAERIQAFLREQTGADLPGNVARTLDEWQAHHERIVLRPGVTLAHGPAAVFDALAADPAAADLLAARPLPDVALLHSPADVPGLVSALREHGQLPLVSAGPAVPPNAVQADDAGRLRFVMPRPSLYLHGHLAAFAEPAGAEEPDAYQISAGSVNRALRAGLTANDLIARLQAVHRGPLPAPLLRRIRAWAKHFGSAALESFTLLQVRDAATLAELRADPELAPLLHDFAPTPGKALAYIHPADVERLRALLHEHGVELKETLE